MNNSNMSNLIKQAQYMQEKMQRMQKDIAKLEVVGESGAGLVKVTINGIYNCQHVELDSTLLKDSKDILEDLIRAAFNDAVRRITEIQKEKMHLTSIDI